MAPCAVRVYHLQQRAQDWSLCVFSQFAWLIVETILSKSISLENSEIVSVSKKSSFYSEKQQNTHVFGICLLFLFVPLALSSL